MIVSPLPVRVRDANSPVLHNRGATIALMAKFKPARGKPKRTAPPPGAISCVILILAGMVLVMLFMYFVLRNANG